MVVMVQLPFVGVLSSSGTRLMNEFRLVLYTETGRGGVDVFPVPVRLADPVSHASTDDCGSAGFPGMLGS
jgi:hypothetical protein